MAVSGYVLTWGLCGQSLGMRPRALRKTQGTSWADAATRAFCPGSNPPASGAHAAHPAAMKRRQSVGGWVVWWWGAGGGQHMSGAPPRRSNCNPRLTTQTRCSTAFIPPEAWPWPFQVFCSAATSSWFSFGPNLSTCELRNHCRSDPVQVQSTV